MMEEYKVTLWRMHEDDSLDGLEGVIKDCEVEGEIRHAFKSNHAKKGQFLVHYPVSIASFTFSHTVIDDTVMT